MKKLTIPPLPRMAYSTKYDHPVIPLLRAAAASKAKDTLP